MDSNDGHECASIDEFKKIIRFFSVSEMTRNSVSGKVWVLMRNLEGIVMSATGTGECFRISWGQAPSQRQKAKKENLDYKSIASKPIFYKNLFVDSFLKHTKTLLLILQ